MAIRYYLLPLEEFDLDVGGAIRHVRRPKYLDALPAGSYRGGIPYGRMNVVIAAVDVTNGQHNNLVANADVRAAPANIDSTVGAGAVDNIRAALEDVGIPGNWVNASDTWRQVLRTTAGLFQFAQRVHGRFGARLLESGVTLNTTWSELPQGAKIILLDTAQELGIDTSGATNSVTLRQIFRAFANAWEDKEIYLGGVLL